MFYVVNFSLCTKLGGRRRFVARARVRCTNLLLYITIQNKKDHAYEKKTKKTKKKYIQK